MTRTGGSSQVPPHPSYPHVRSSHSGEQQSPEAHTGATKGQVPQSPPQPSEPHSFPSQPTIQEDTQLPWEQSGLSVGQEPQFPPQPSVPHSLPKQSGEQEEPMPSGDSPSALQNPASASQELPGAQSASLSQAYWTLAKSLGVTVQPVPTRSDNERINRNTPITTPHTQSPQRPRASS